MAGINITAQLQGPTNLRSFVQNIQSQLNGIKANITLNMSSSANSSLNKLTTSMNTLNKSVGDLIHVMTYVASASNKLGNNLSSLSGSTNTVNNSMRKATQTFTDTASSMENFGQVAGLATRRFLGFSLAAGAMVKFTSSLKDGVSEALNFQQTMIKLVQVAEGSTEGVKDLEKEISRLATTFGVSSKELADTALTLRQAGLSISEVKVAMEALAKASLAPTFDGMAKTVEGVIAIMSQFKIQAKDVEGALGSINAASAAFAVESSDIIEAVKRAGGAFKSVGGELNEFIALFTAVRSTTREGSDAIATGLRTIFTRLQRNDTVEALKALQINLRYTREEAQKMGDGGLENQFVGAYEAVKRLGEGLKGLRSTDPRYSAVVEQLGGYRQISRVIPLLQEATTIQKAYTVAQNGQISVSIAAAQAQEGYLVKMEKVKQQFLELVRTFANSGSFKTIIDSSLSLASSIIKITEALTPLLPMLTTLAAIKMGQSLGSFATGFAGGISGKSNPRLFAKGGPVPGQGNQDTIEARLTPGEHVIDKQSVQRMGGHSAIEQMKRFANGGVVPGSGHGDTVPAQLQSGSFVLRKSATNSIGSHNIQRLTGGGEPERFHWNKDEKNNAYEKPHVLNSSAAVGEMVNDMLSDMKEPDIKTKHGLSGDKPLGKNNRDSLRPSKTSVGRFGETLVIPTNPADRLAAISLVAGNMGGYDREVSVQSSDYGENHAKKLKDAGVKTIKMKADRHAISQTRQDEFSSKFTDAIGREIAVGLEKEFPGQKGLELNKQEKDTISGVLLGKYVTGITKIAGDTSSNANWDFHSGAFKDQGEYPFLYPSKILAHHVDVKKSSKLITGLAGKYFNSLGDAGMDQMLGIQKFASGGMASGKDTVPAMLTPGEFVVNPSSVNKIGLSKLHEMNATGKVQKFSDGGFVWGDGKRGKGPTVTEAINNAAGVRLSGNEYFPAKLREGNFSKEKENQTIQDAQTEIKKQLVEAEKKRLERILPNIKGEERHKLALDGVEEALRKNARVITDTNGKIIGTAQAHLGDGKNTTLLAESQKMKRRRDTTAIGDTVGELNAHTEGTVKEGMLSKIKKNYTAIGALALGTGASYAAEGLAPRANMTDEEIAGSSSYKRNKAMSGALTGASSGAMIGMVAGPWGAAAGAAVGLAIGMVNSMKEAEIEITRANITLAGKKLSSAISSGNQGQSLKSMKDLDENIYKHAEEKGSSIWNFTEESKVKDINIEHKKARQEAYSSQLPEFSKALGTSAEEIGMANAGKNFSKDEFYKQFLGNKANVKMIDKIHNEKGGPIEDIKKQFADIAKTASIKKSSEDMGKRGQEQFNFFISGLGKLNNSLDMAVNAGEKFSKGLEDITSELSGTFSNKKLDIPLSGIGMMGKGSANFGAAIDTVAANGGGKEYKEMAMAIDKVATALPDVITDIASGNFAEGGDPQQKAKEQLRSKLGVKDGDQTSADAVYIDKIVNRMSKEGELKDVNTLMNSAGGAKAFSNRLTQPDVDEQTKSASDAMQKLAQIVNSLGKGLNDYYKTLNVVGAEQDKVSMIEADRAKTLASIDDNRTGSRTEDTFSMQPFLDKQTRLNGGKFDPAAIKKDIDNARNNLQVQEAGRDAALKAGDTDTQMKFTAGIEEANNTLNNFKEALKNSADAARQEVQVSLEKVRALQAERSQRMSMAQIMKFGSSKEKQALNDNRAMAQRSILEGTDGLTDGQKAQAKLGLEQGSNTKMFKDKNGNLITGSEGMNQVINNDPSMKGIVDTPQMDAARAELDNAFKKEIDVRNQSIDIMKDLNEKSKKQIEDRNSGETTELADQKKKAAEESKKAKIANLQSQKTNIGGAGKNYEANKAFINSQGLMQNGVFQKEKLDKVHNLSKAFKYKESLLNGEDAFKLTERDYSEGSSGKYGIKTLGLKSDVKSKLEQMGQSPETSATSSIHVVDAVEKDSRIIDALKKGPIDRNLLEKVTREHISDLNKNSLQVGGVDTASKDYIKAQGFKDKNGNEASGYDQLTDKDKAKFNEAKNLTDIGKKDITRLGGEAEREGGFKNLELALDRLTQAIIDTKSGVEHKAGGGIAGMHPGSARGTDTIPAWLTPGEGVIKKAAMTSDVKHLVNKLNAGGKYYANGTDDASIIQKSMDEYRNKAETPDPVQMERNAKIKENWEKTVNDLDRGRGLNLGDKNGIGGGFMDRAGKLLKKGFNNTLNSFANAQNANVAKNNAAGWLAQNDPLMAEQMGLYEQENKKTMGKIKDKFMMTQVAKIVNAGQNNANNVFNGKAKFNKNPERFVPKLGPGQINLNGRPVQLANGGVVPGFGNTDSVPALLTPGEIVVPKKYANGGVVSNSSSASFGGMKIEMPKEFATASQLISSAFTSSIAPMNALSASLNNLPKMMEKLGNIPSKIDIAVSPINVILTGPDMAGVGEGMKKEIMAAIDGMINNKIQSVLNSGDTPVIGSVA